MMTAPTTAAAFKTKRSRLDLIRVAWPSETLAHNAKPAAIELSEDACGTARAISGIVPSIAAMPYAVTSLNPLIRRWTPGSIRSSHCPTFTSARRRCASRGKAGLAAGSVGGVAGCISGCSAIKCITAHQSLRDGRHNDYSDQSARNGSPYSGESTIPAASPRRTIATAVTSSPAF